MIMCPEGDRRSHMLAARRVIGVAILAALVILAASWFEERQPTGSTARYVLVGIQIVAGILVVIAMARWSPRGDELHQRIQLEALSFAFWTTAALALSYSFLRDAGVQEIDSSLIFLVMIILYGLGFAVAWRRYQ